MGAMELRSTLQTPSKQAVYYHDSCKNKKQEQQEHVVVVVEEEGQDEGESGRGEELIPGLPDDLATECLVRVPSGSQRRMRRVCRGWRRAVGSAEFRRRRRVAGAVEDVVLVVQAAVAGRDGKESPPACGLAAANLTTGEWRHVEGAGWGPVPLFAQCAAVGDGRHVAVLGGWDPSTFRPARDVRVLDLATGAWRRCQPMPDSRSFFGCAGGDGHVYVAGGHDESKNALRSTLAYDIAAEAWRALPDMSEERDEPQLVAAPGRVLAASGYPTDAQGSFKNNAEWWDTASSDHNNWSNEGTIILGTPGARLAMVGGKVCSVGAGKGGVREWEGAEGSWTNIADGPPGMKACVKAVGVGNAVFVFGSVTEEEGKHAAWVMDAGSARWRQVAVPPMFRGFVYSAAAVQV